MNIAQDILQFTSGGLSHPPPFLLRQSLMKPRLASNSLCNKEEFNLSYQLLIPAFPFPEFQDYSHLPPCLALCACSERPLPTESLTQPQQVYEVEAGSETSLGLSQEYIYLTRSPFFFSFFFFLSCHHSITKTMDSNQKHHVISQSLNILYSTR